jgi:hypothetical protein
MAARRREHLFPRPGWASSGTGDARIVARILGLNVRPCSGRNKTLGAKLASACRTKSFLEDDMPNLVGFDSFATLPEERVGSCRISYRGVLIRVED